MAKTLLTGDTQAVAEGYPSIFNRTELETLHIAATAAEATLHLADIALQEAQGQLHKSRQQVTRLCRTVINDLRYALIDQEPVARRQVMRIYGVPIQAASGEFPAPAEPPVPSETEKPVSTAEEQDAPAAALTPLAL